MYFQSLADLTASTPELEGILDSARKLSAAPEEEGTAAAPLLHLRMLPASGSLYSKAAANWSSGMTPGDSLGPFLDRLGRQTWVDIFPVVRNLRFERSAGAAPFLVLPVEMIAGHQTLFITPKPAPTEFKLSAGSIWIQSQQLAAAAPAGCFTGLKIKKGTLQLSAAPTLGVTDNIIVPPTVTIIVNLTLDPPTASSGAGSGPGADARAAAAAPPKTVRFIFTAAGARLDHADKARMRAYGCDVGLTLTGASPVFIPAFNQIAFPATPSISSFTISSVASTTFAPNGRAPIADAAWTVPVATVDPAYLGTASGAGALALGLSPGLRAAWLGQPRTAMLEGCVVSVDTQTLAVAAAAARGERLRMLPQLGASGADQLDLSWQPQFSLVFVSQAAGPETMWTDVRLDASFSKPVDLNGWRLALHSDVAALVLLVTAAEWVLILEAALSGNSQQPVAFSLVNGVLAATWPTTLYLAADFDGTKCVAGGVLLAYRLLAVLPTLPDPYASSGPSWLGTGDRAVGRRNSPLLETGDSSLNSLFSLLAWTAVADKFDFLLPPSSLLPQTAGKSAGTIPGAPPARSAIYPPGQTAPADVAYSSTVRNPLGALLQFEQDNPFVLLDVSTKIDQFGVAIRQNPSARVPVAIRDLRLQLAGDQLMLITVPAVQWEVVHTEQDPGPGPFPEKLDFANSGLPSWIGVPTAALVPVYPEEAIARLVENFASPTPSAVTSRFTLPFGMLAQVELRAPDAQASETRGAALSLNRPTQGSLTGAYQLRIDALDPALPADESPSLPGFTVQLANGQPGPRSVLGVTPTDIFNSYLGPGGARPLVPVVRMELSGYGESLFSDWRNPYLDPVAVSQARFDVLIGRVSFEVVQVRTKLFFHGVDFVRTITMERKNTAVIVRRDSGWTAVSDGFFTFPGTSIATHPGVVRRVTNVVNVRETGQIVTVDGFELATVYFDGDLQIDGVPDLVAAKDQLGFIQLTAGALLPPSAYAHALDMLGPLGGPIDANLHIGSGNIAMRLHRVDVAATQGMGGPEFVVAAWGSPVFPGGGEWMFLRAASPASTPEAVPLTQGVPLIRAGLAGTAPLPSSPYRIADPQDLANPTNPAHEYGLVHATGTQRAFFPRPRVEATDTSRIVSTEIPLLADPYLLSTANGAFPALSLAVPFPSNNWAFAVNGSGQYKLELPASPFPIGYAGRRTLKQAGSVKGDVDYTGAQVTYAVDTSQATSWTFALDGAVKIMNTSSLGDMIILAANIRASSGQPDTTFEQPNLKLGGALSIVQDVLTILADLGIQGVMSVQMTNDWSLKAKVTVPVVDAAGEPLQVPPLVPNPSFKLDDTGVEVELDIAPAMDKAQFALVGQPMIAVDPIHTPGLYVVGLIKFSIQISTVDGTTYGLLIGFGIAYELDLANIGSFKLGFKGLFALTFFGFIGNNALGFGIGFLLKLGLSIDPIISIEIYLEGQLAVVSVCRGTGHDTTYGAAKLTFGVEIHVCLIFSISFEVETTASKVISGPGGTACPLPDILPSAS